MTAPDPAADAAIARLLGGEPCDETWAAFVPWLVREAGADDRHRVALDWNWDGGYEVLAWIGSRPDCDKATALLLFWNGQPEYDVEFDGDRAAIPTVNAEGSHFLEDVRTRWRSGAYTRAELAFSLSDAATWPRDFAALDAAFGERARIELPPDMREPLAGRVLTTAGYTEGIPDRFWP